ncbi:MAG: hypothetical protein ABI836_11095 [Gemmatimonadota bacterium]
MAPESAPDSVARAAPELSREGQLRLVLQRLLAGYYEREDVLRKVAQRILRSP